MLVAALWCPVELAVAGRDHYAIGECLDPPAPEAWLAATLAEIEGDVDHRDNRSGRVVIGVCENSMPAEYDDHNHQSTEGHYSARESEIEPASAFKVSRLS